MIARRNPLQKCVRGVTGAAPDGGASVAAKPKIKATPKGGATRTNKSKPEPQKPEPKKPEPKKPELKKPEPKKPEPVITPAPAVPERRSKIPPKLTVRQPAGADELKAKIGALATATAQIRALKRTLARSFMDVGTILIDIRDRRLYEAKGYGSFEAFLEREIELGKTASLRLTRAVELFQRPAAISGGMDKVLAAVAAFDGDTETQSGPTPPTSSGGLRSPIPFHKR
ncbi:MAG: hypothetical protein ACK6CU_05030 [Deltaproteobacteria bacterium]